MIEIKKCISAILSDDEQEQVLEDFIKGAKSKGIEKIEYLHQLLNETPENPRKYQYILCFGQNRMYFKKWCVLLLQKKELEKKGTKCWVIEN